jgi:hypothetical protein
MIQSQLDNRGLMLNSSLGSMLLGKSHALLMSLHDFSIHVSLGAPVA